MTAKAPFGATPSEISRFAMAGACLLCPFFAGAHGAVVMVAILAAAMVGGIAGFAFPVICGAMLFHLGDDPVCVVQILITCSIANQMAMTWRMRRHIDWPVLRVFLAGGALGVLIGSWVLLHADRSIYIPAVGAFLIIYGTYMLVRRPMVVHRQYPVLDFAAGLLGGITGGALATPSMPVAIWCSMKGWDKVRQRALFQPFILIMQVFALLVISLARGQGAARSGFDVSDLLFVPASLLGTSLGLACYAHLSDGQFTRGVNVLLVVCGLSFLF